MGRALVEFQRRHHRVETIKLVSPSEVEFLDYVRAGGQVERLREKWPLLGGWTADPYFGTVQEHTSAFIEQVAAKELS